jgi:hypothetical protein
MNVSEIKAAIDAGKVVHWGNEGYKVTRGKSGQYFIKHAQGHCISLAWADGETLNGKEEDFYIAARDFTVIGFYESTGQIFSHHVKSDSIMGAFAVVASMDCDAMPIAAIAGELHEGESVAFVGEGLVDAETILAQPDVFGGE